LADGRILTYKQVDGVFSNPNSHVNVSVLDWLCANMQQLQKETACNMTNNLDFPTDDKKMDLLELYCGNGNHTLALASSFRRVLAVELSKVLVEAAIENLRENGIDNVTVVACDSEKMAHSILRKKTYFDPKSLSEELHFGIVLVDPPRAGLDCTTRELVARYNTLIYISCNPSALIKDLLELQKTHIIIAAAAFDHFPYTPHLEMGVILQKRDL
jgi:tRNA (uracil-5-)-methyltransferase